MNWIKKYKLPIIIIASLFVLIVTIFVMQDFIASTMTVLAGAGAAAAALQNKWSQWLKSDKDIKDDIKAHDELVDNLNDDDLSSEIDESIKRRNKKRNRKTD